VPAQDEARAALYNGACARARLRQWQEAADDVVRAVNEFGLKFEVAAKARPSLCDAPGSVQARGVLAPDPPDTLCPSPQPDPGDIQRPPVPQSLA
jgi:hypothetical protein